MHVNIIQNSVITETYTKIADFDETHGAPLSWQVVQIPSTSTAVASEPGHQLATSAPDLAEQGAPAGSAAVAEEEAATASVLGRVWLVP